jgi:ABC-2 type transport system permease protein
MSVVTYIVAGALLGVDFSVANIPAAILALALTLVSYSGLGVLAAALVILIKRGNPLGWLIRGGSIVLGGVFYPTDVLPQALQVVAQALPVTHSLDVLRRTVLLGEGLDQVAGGLLALVLLSAIYIPLGLLAFAGAVRIARTDGSLGHY